MDHPTVERRATISDHRGPDGHGIVLGIWLCLPLWLGLGLIMSLIQP